MAKQFVVVDHRWLPPSGDDSSSGESFWAKAFGLEYDPDLDEEDLDVHVFCEFGAADLANERENILNLMVDSKAEIVVLAISESDCIASTREGLIEAGFEDATGIDYAHIPGGEIIPALPECCMTKTFETIHGYLPRGAKLVIVGPMPPIHDSGKSTEFAEKQEKWIAEWHKTADDTHHISWSDFVKRSGGSAWNLIPPHADRDNASDAARVVGPERVFSSMLHDYVADRLGEITGDFDY